MVLPLHAAGHHTGDSDAAVLDRVLSSYTPALKTLVHARERRDAEPAAGAGHSRRLLHVTLADTPGQASLPGVSRTKSYFDQLFPAERLTNLDGAKVSRTSVEEQIYRHAWAHFDCHGVQNLTSPFQGGLVLHDQTLVVADLAGIRHDGAEFAFLAACQTAVGGARIPDESITITSAFQYAGYQHVIGTQWSVPDRVTARIIKSVYDVIVTDGELNPAQAAQALHKALCAERSNGRQHPSAWAPFIHVGL